MTPKEKALEMVLFLEPYMDQDSNWAMRGNAIICANKWVNDTLRYSFGTQCDFEYLMDVKDELEILNKENT